MSRNIVLRDDTGGNGTAKSDLTVPSENVDIRVVAETERRVPPKRKFSKGKVNMAKESKTANARPVRKVKLNRSIFNDSYQKQSSFRVKTLDEIKRGKEEHESTTTISTQVNVQVNASSSTPSVETSVEPAMPNAAVVVDTRNVTQLNPVQKLLLPTIQLTRISSGNYTRSITKTISPRKKPRKIMSEAALERFYAQKAKLNQEALKSQPMEASPTKKRRISPIRSPEDESQFESQTEDTTWSMVPLEVNAMATSPEKPRSPPLSLGAQSDHELDDNVEPERETVARVVLNAEDERQKSPEFKTPAMQQNFQIPAAARLNLRFAGVDDDKLDVMSIMADDDELFSEDKQRPVLKRSLSQDSVFDNLANKEDDRGDLRSLLVKPNDGESNVKQSVGDLILSGSISKNYKIPLVNQNDEKTPVRNVVNNFADGRRSPGGTGLVCLTGNSRGRNMPSRKGVGLDRQNRGNKSHGQTPPHARQRTIFADNQGMINRIKFDLECGNVMEAGALFNKLDKAKCDIDVILLEEMLKVCERVSQTNGSPLLGAVILDAFELIKRIQGEAKSTDFIMVILSLCQCRRVSEGFDRYLAMKAAGKFPPEDDLEHIINVLGKCLVFMPHKLIDLLQDVITFSLTPQRKTHLVNNCVASLISCIPVQLRKVDSVKWNSLLVMLCNPPSYVQSALQVHNVMEKIGILLSPPTVYQLFRVTKESKAIKPLLKLICSKATRAILVECKPPVDVSQILTNPNVKAREIEECLSSLVKEGAMLDDIILHQFIAKALLTKEYAIIHQFFVKCRMSPISLSVPVLKHMMEALENWDENAGASVEVYAAHRLAIKNAAKHPVPNRAYFNTGTYPKGDGCKFPKDNSNPRVGEGQSKELDGESDQKQTQFDKKNSSTHNNPGTGRINKPAANGPQFANKMCFRFMKSGRCWNGDRCHYAHGPQSSGYRPENHHQGIGGSQSMALGCKSDQKPSAPTHNSGPGVVNKTMVNGLIQNQPRHRYPFPSFQVLAHGTNHRAFNHPQVFSRPPFKPQFQRNFATSNQMPRVPVFKQDHTQPHNLGKQVHQDAGKSQPGAPVSQRSSSQPSPVIEKPKVGRSFSWEPQSNVKPNLHNGWKVQPNPKFNPGNDSNNNAKAVTKLQQQIEAAIKSKQWQTVHVCYVECKGTSSQHAAHKDLMMFRNGFVKNSGSFGQNFSAFIEFLHKEKCTDGSCISNQSALDVFDQYDIDFIGALGVSLMEKCLVAKQFDEGYEVLLCLHSHSISYFQSGKNFGAYTKDIPSQNVALIAVKLCLGLDQHGGLGAMEVLRACNYALSEEGELITPQDKEYRIKVLHQLYLHLFKEDHVLECFEVLQKLNASTSFEGMMYNQVLNHFVTADDFDQSFTVLDEMQKKGMDLNSPPCHLLYEKFFKHCIASREYGQATDALKKMESMGISGGVFRSILGMLSSPEQDPLANLLFEKCIDLKIYPNTFCLKTPWLCELGCGYSQQELKLLICKYLVQLHNYLLSQVTSDKLVTAVKNFQIVLFPRISGFDTGLKITDGIQAPLDNSNTTLAKVLQEDLNPPLAVLEQSGEQFHRKIIIEKMSVYRWFCANTTALQQSVDDGQDEFETSSEGSVASDYTAC